MLKAKANRTKPMCQPESALPKRRAPPRMEATMRKIIENRAKGKVLPLNFFVFLMADWSRW